MPTTALQTQQMTASLNLRSRSRTRSELPLSALHVEMCMAQQSDRFSISSLS
jgi:hypothetical protein